jgi:hypothetical protein
MARSRTGRGRSGPRALVARLRARCDQIHRGRHTFEQVGDRGRRGGYAGRARVLLLLERLPRAALEPVWREHHRGERRVLFGELRIYHRRFWGRPADEANRSSRRRRRGGRSVRAGGLPVQLRGGESLPAVPDVRARRRRWAGPRLHSAHRGATPLVPGQAWPGLRHGGVRLRRRLGGQRPRRDGPDLLYRRSAAHLRRSRAGLPRTDRRRSRARQEPARRAGRAETNRGRRKDGGSSADVGLPGGSEYLAVVRAVGDLLP